MAREQSLLGMDLDMEGIGFEDQLAPGFFDGNGIAIGFIGDLTVAIEMHHPGHATVKRPLGQWTQTRLLALEGFSDADRLPINHTHIVTQAMLQQLLIELLEGGHTRHGHQVVSAAKSHRPLDASLLMPLMRRAEMGLEEVMTAKRNEGALFFPNPSLHEWFDGTGKIVITDAYRNTPKEREAAHMPIEERFLGACWERHDKRAARVAQMHHEDLHGLPLA